MLHVELAEPESAGRARDALAGLGSVEPPDPAAPTRVVLRTPAGKGAIAPVIRALDEHDVVVESVEVETPTLDDVFAAVTGSHLEGAAPVEAPA
jgi:ABC-2 type transport system ATP-binding protein